jgi:hypothetical protein
MPRDISGEWAIVQSNGAEVTFTLVPQPPDNITFTGSAQFSGDNGSIKLAPPGSNPNGQVTDTAFFARVQWNGGPIGNYHGNFGIDGRLTGITFDELHPVTQATFFSRKFFNFF